MNALSFVILSVILAVTASPLGDHAVFRRHNGAQPLARRYVLESRMDIPPQCASASGGTPASSDPSATNIAIPSGLTLPSDLFPSGAEFSDAVPTAATHDGSAISTDPPSFRRSFSGFDISEESSFSSFVQTWETLCLSSGGDIYTNDPCSQLADFAGVNALMEFADPCDQQHIADSMITFAKSKGIKNEDSLIKFALQYRKHYRNSVEILGIIPSSFYCMETPVNSELDGVYNEQMSGANPGIFGSPSSPLAPFGSTGTCPLGMTADMSTCSCASSASSGNSTFSGGSSSDGSSNDSYSNDSLSYDGSTDSVASTYSIATATDSSYVNATATYTSSYADATAIYSSYDNATATYSSYVNATATYTSSYVNATATYTNSYVNATATYSSNATAYSSYVSATTTYSSNSTASATATYYSSSLASTTDSSTMTATDSTAPAATVSATSTAS